MDAAITLRVPLRNLDRFQTKVAKFEKKARRSGVAFACERLYSLAIERMKKSPAGLPRPEWDRFEVYQVATPETVHIPGWTLLGVIDRTHSEAVLYAAPGREVPPSFRDGDGRCDHCNTRRQRKETFALQHDDGRLVEIGRNCLADYLPDANVSDILAWAALQRRAVKEFGEDDDEIFGCSGRPWAEDLMLLLPMVARCIRASGWTSSSRAYDCGDRSVVATIEQARHEFTELSDWERRNGVVRLIVEDEDYAVAEASIAWCAASTEESPYMTNLRTLAKDGWYKLERESGLAASMVAAYQKSLRDAAAKAREADRRAAAAPVPVTDARIEIAGVVVKLGVRSTDYGDSPVMTVEDDRGFRLWGTVPAALNGEVAENDRVSFVAKVVRSDRDETFGFFKRPTKAEVVAA